MRKASPTNNFKFLYPEIAKDWHPTKNGELKPENVTKSSGKKVWWICSKNNDHKWKATVASRTVKNTNCPYCKNKKASPTNNFKFLYPEIAKDWHPTKNGELKPENVTKSSGKKVWWLCPNGHTYLARVSRRTQSARKQTSSRRGTGCLKCYNLHGRRLSKNSRIK